MYDLNYLGQNVLDHMSMDIRKTKITALVAIGEFSVVDPELVEDGRIEVMDVHGARSPVIFVGLGL